MLICGRRGGAWCVWLVVLGLALVAFGVAGWAASSAGRMWTVAGGGRSGGDGVPATKVALGFPDGVAVDAVGDLLVAEDPLLAADRPPGDVRLVAAASCSSGCVYGLGAMTKGDIYTVAGNGRGGYSGDGGPATKAELSQPTGVAVDLPGDLLIADEGTGRVRLVAAASCSRGCPYGLAAMTKGDIYTIAGGAGSGLGDGGPATKAHLRQPEGVAVDGLGDLLIADEGNDRAQLVAGASCSHRCPYRLAAIRKGYIYTVAGSRTSRLGDGGPATKAQLSQPAGVAVDWRGDLLIASWNGNRVRLVAAASCSSGCPYGLAAMRKGYIYTVAGNGREGSRGDGGPAGKARLHAPSGAAVDPGGDLLIGDSGNSRVRLVARASCSRGCPYGLAAMTKGDIYTIAGGGRSSKNGALAAKSQLGSGPYGVAVDPGGDLLIADSYAQVVRLVTVGKPFS